MAIPVEPQKSSGSPMKWVLIGCGCLVALLVVAAIIGCIWYFSKPKPTPTPIPNPTTTTSTPTTTTQQTTSVYKNATICQNITQDYEPISPTTVYTTNAPSFYVTFEVGDIPADSVAEGVWIAEDVQGITKDYEIDTSRVTLQPNWVGYFALDAGGEPWPTGTYRVDMYLNSKFQETHKFSVQ